MAEISINIKIHNRVYKIKIDDKNESVVRNATLKINEKLLSLKKTFPSQDEIDYLSMTLIDYITSNQQSDMPSHADAIELKLSAINELLDS